MLSSFFLRNILQVIANWGYNPVSNEICHHKLLETYPNIGMFLTGTATINNGESNKVARAMCLVLPNTFFHRIVFLYYIYMNIPAVVEKNYDALYAYYNTNFVEETKGRFQHLKILKFDQFFRHIYQCDFIETNDSNDNPLQTMLDAMDLIEHSNFFVPDPIDLTTTEELCAMQKPDQLDIINRSQHDILLHMFTMALYDNDYKTFADKIPTPTQRNNSFNVNEFYQLFKSILNVTKTSNPIICPQDQNNKRKRETSDNDNVSTTSKKTKN